MKLSFFICILLLFAYEQIALQYAGTEQIMAQLPVKEFQSHGNSDYFVLLYTGDGGWKSLAMDLAGYFQKKNISVVGLDVRKYFWTKRNQSEISSSLKVLIEHYATAWHKSKVVLIGYSFGAEVLPFAISEQNQSLIEMIKKIIMIAPGQKAEFEVTFGSMLDVSNDGLQISPEMAKINVDKFYIICDDSEEALCSTLNDQYDIDVLKGGHHFDGDFQELNSLIWNKLVHLSSR